jgi:hypothetical protein
MKKTAKTNVKDHEQARAEITYKGKKAIMSLDWEKPSRFYIHVRGSGVNEVIAEEYDPRAILKEWVKAMKQYQGELVARTPKQKELLQKQKELAAGFWKSDSPFFAPGFLRAIRVAYLKDIREGDLKLSPGDKKVLDAFTSQQPAEGKKFSSDGTRLDGLWMGGRGIAEWKGGKLHIRNPTSRSDQTVARMLKKMTPKNLLAAAVRQAQNLWLPREIPSKARSMVGQVGKALDWDVTAAAGFAVAILEDVNAHDAAKKVNILLNKLVLQDVSGKVTGEDAERAPGELSAADKEAYRLYFQRKMKEWGIKSPAELDDAKKKKFFDEVDKGWKGEGEKEGTVRKGADSGPAMAAQKLAKQGKYAQAIKEIQKLPLTDMEGRSLKTAIINILDEASYEQASPKYVNGVMDNLVKYLSNRASMRPQEVLRVKGSVRKAAATWNVKGKPPAKEFVKPLVDSALAVAAKRVPDLLKGVTKMELTYGPGRQMADVEGKLGTLTNRFEVSVIREYDEAGTWHVAVQAGKVKKEWSDKGAKGAQIGATIAKLLGQGLQAAGKTTASVQGKREDRDYAKEYRDYHSKPEQKKNRAKRNSARRQLGLSKGDPREVDHKTPLSKGGGNSEKNLRAVSRDTNRQKGAKPASARQARKDPQIAKTILQQLGGAGRLKAMLGAKHFIDHGDGLSFQFPNPKRNRGNYFKVTLDEGSDTYILEIGKIAGSSFKKLKDWHGVYADQMKRIFEDFTGLRMSL